MKRSLRVLVLSCLTAVMLTVTAFADMGPKAQLTVKVENAPEELYYLDILAKGEPVDRTASSTDDFEKELAQMGVTDTELYDALMKKIPAGWHGCISHGTDGPPVSGKLTGEPENGQMLHTFGYHPPQTYRLLLCTQSGQCFLSDILRREALQSSVTIDWADQTVSVPPAWIGYVLQFLATFVPTLLTEGLLLALFGFGRQKRNWLCFLAVNFITQGALAVMMSNTFINHGVTGWSLLPFVLLETVIALGEALLYARLLKGPPKGQAVAYGLAANVCSAVLGLYLAEPVWRFVVSIS
ncbi:MAG: hypothetical protein Q4C45_01860 [Oscillospiraceae bacterium]|nr:hypothetical protein [Oscillospiraceae bacterium]